MLTHMGTGPDCHGPHARSSVAPAGSAAVVIVHPFARALAGADGHVCVLHGIDHLFKFRQGIR